MRLAFALLALAALLATAPAASAAVALPTQELPVGVRVHHSETLPGEDCPTCLDVRAGVGFGVVQCCDMPFFGVGGGLANDEEGAEVRAYACYTAFVGVCFVDATIPVL